MRQHGLLRPLKASELSDGTLRYLLLVAALLSPRPPTLMILNEPETSLHPDLLPPLARLIEQAASAGRSWWSHMPRRWFPRSRLTPIARRSSWRRTWRNRRQEQQATRMDVAFAVIDLRVP